MSNVVFLPGLRQTTEEEWERLDDIQDALSMFHINFEYENRRLTEAQQKEKKAEVHFKLRQSMTVVKK